MTPAERRPDSGGLNPDPVEILIGVRGDFPAPMTSSERAIAKAQWECITQTAWWRSRSTAEQAQDTRPTMKQLADLLPNAAVESTCSGEVIVYTGWAVNSKDRDGPLVDWCDECESGDDVPDDGCRFCGRGS